MHGRTAGKRDGRIDGKTDRQTHLSNDIHADTQTYGHGERQTDSQTDGWIPYRTDVLKRDGLLLFDNLTKTAKHELSKIARQPRQND